MKTPKNFTLTKVKRISGGGLKVEYSYSESAEGSDMEIHKIKHDSPKAPHPDLYKALDKLAGRLAKSVGLLDTMALDKYSYSNEKAREAWKLVKGYVESVHQELVESVTINEVSFGGELGTVSVVIDGVLDRADGSVVNLSSPTIKLEDEVELQDLLSDLKTEVQEYIFKGKSAQLSMDLKAA